METNTFVKKLRVNETPTERILWQKLRDRRFCNIKFRRQHRIGPYIVDFYCSQHRLIIEIDGSVHFKDQHTIDRDKLRQLFLETKGFFILRFTTRDIQQSLHLVLEAIYTYTHRS